MVASNNKYYLFIDESGDHGLTTLNHDFPIFLLCGVLVSEPEYFAIRDEFKRIKSEFWKNKKVIFHSRDIRKCEKEFQILFDMELKATFYEKLNNCIKKGNFTVIASAIRKDNYIKKFGRLSNDVYELALSFMIERSVFYMDGIQLADLVAYPTARYVIDQKRANPAFDIIEPKIYSKKGKRYGLKIFP